MTILEVLEEPMMVNEEAPLVERNFEDALAQRDFAALGRHAWHESWINVPAMPETDRPPTDGDAWIGDCPICARRTLFLMDGKWPREALKCVICRTVPRKRAFYYVLQTHIPEWRKHRIHESSPSGGLLNKMRTECPKYVATQFFPGVERGTVHRGFRCEDLEAQTFDDESLDLVLTQDVFEHLFDAEQAFAEIARTLRPGGAHVFTVPWYHWKETLLRARRVDGRIEHLLPPQFHGNPVDPEGSLVVREWGWNLCDVIFKSSGLMTSVYSIRDRFQGIDARFIEVFVSEKAGGTSVRARTSYEA